jgi:hypothetical protein
MTAIPTKLKIVNASISSTATLSSSVLRVKRMSSSISSTVSTTVNNTKIPGYVAGVNDATYFPNQVLWFTSARITDDNPGTSSYTISFTASQGEFGDYTTTSSSTYSFTGTFAQCNTWLSQIYYYPPPYYTGNTTFTYTQIKAGTTQLTKTVNLTSAEYQVKKTTYMFTSNDNWTPTIEEKKYCLAHALVVGGGGGATGAHNFGGAGGDGGQVKEVHYQNISASSYSITVGTGGTANNTRWNGTTYPTTITAGDGSSSSAFGVTAAGGAGSIFSVTNSTTGQNGDYFWTTSGGINLSGFGGKGFDYYGGNDYSLPAVLIDPTSNVTLSSVTYNSSGNSARFNGSGYLRTFGYSSINESYFYVGSSDYTNIRLTYRLDNLSTVQRLFSTSDDSMYLQVNTDGSITFKTLSQTITSSAGAVSSNTWYTIQFGLGLITTRKSFFWNALASDGSFPSTTYRVVGTVTDNNSYTPNGVILAGGVSQSDGATVTNPMTGYIDWIWIIDSAINPTTGWGHSVSSTIGTDISIANPVSRNTTLGFYWGFASGFIEPGYIGTLTGSYNNGNRTAGGNGTESELIKTNYTQQSFDPAPYLYTYTGKNFGGGGAGGTGKSATTDLSQPTLVGYGAEEYYNTTLAGIAPPTNTGIGGSAGGYDQTTSTVLPATAGSNGVVYIITTNSIFMEKGQ